MADDQTGTVDHSLIDIHEKRELELLGQALLSRSSRDQARGQESRPSGRDLLPDCHTLVG